MIDFNFEYTEYRPRGYARSMDLTKIPQLPDWLCDLTKHEKMVYLCPALQWHADRAMAKVVEHLHAGRNEQIGEEQLNTPEPIDMPQYNPGPLRRGFSIEGRG